MGSIVATINIFLHCVNFTNFFLKNYLNNGFIFQVNLIVPAIFNQKRKYIHDIRIKQQECLSALCHATFNVGILV